MKLFQLFPMTSLDNSHVFVISQHSKLACRSRDGAYRHFKAYSLSLEFEAEGCKVPICI